MNALLVLYAGSLSAEAAEPLAAGKNSLTLAMERARQFPGTGKIVMLTGPQGEIPPVLEGIQVEKRDSWTIKGLLEAIAAHSTGFDLTYFAWADCPFLDPALAGKLAQRHMRYAAEYSYADGWPYGLAPELLSPGTAAILPKLWAITTARWGAMPCSPSFRKILMPLILRPRFPQSISAATA